jgi:hypothetical protein
MTEEMQGEVPQGAPPVDPVTAQLTTPIKLVETDPLALAQKEQDAQDNPQAWLLKEKRVCEADPMTLLRLKYLYIKTKKKELVPLIPNEVQQMVLAEIRKLRIAKKPVRMAILKGRQFGISTLLEAIIYAFTSQVPNTNSLIMSDDEDGSRYLFEMTKLYHDELAQRERHLAPEKKYSNDQKLEFAHRRSQILIDTSKNVDAGRKYTFHLAHLSEVSRFKSFLETLLSLMQSIPDNSETMCFLETTANGENDFCNWWRQKEDEIKQGNTDWVLMFLSWKYHKEYRKEFITESEKEYFVKSMTVEERQIQEEHGLDLEQMYWRRRTLVDKCNGKIEQFKQEYPLTADEAFISSGKRVFPVEITKPQVKNIIAVKARGEVEFGENRSFFRAAEDGYLKIYKSPMRGHRYVIAADSSDGFVGGDPAAAQVLDVTTWEQAAVLHGNIPPDIFGTKLFALGAFYNWALIAPEVNNQGLVTTLKLRDLHYPAHLIAHHEKVNFDITTGERKIYDELGWATSAKTKPLIISDLQEALREILLVLHDADTLAELNHYSVLPDGTWGGAGGYHDDRVMSLAIGVHFAKNMIQYIGTGDAGANDDRDERQSRTIGSTGY